MFWCAPLKTNKDVYSRKLRMQSSKKKMEYGPMGSLYHEKKESSFKDDSECAFKYFASIYGVGVLLGRTQKRGFASLIKKMSTPWFEMLN